MLKNINRYCILKKELIFMEEISKATRKKFKVYNYKKKKFGIFKYPSHRKRFFKEIFSEKISSEIARKLGVQTASIDLALDYDGNIGIVSYLFTDTSRLEQHIDFADFFTDSSKSLKRHYYNFDNIKKILDSINDDLFFQFLQIIIFDALVGETDRHWGNWGIKTEYTKGQRVENISPLYDTAACLLRDYGDNTDIPDDIEKLDDYIYNSKSEIRKNDGSKYGHFEMISYLLNEYGEISKELIKKITRVSDNEIKRIVTKIPRKYVDNRNKQFIIKYIIRRRDILKSMIKEGKDENL